VTKLFFSAAAISSKNADRLLIDLPSLVLASFSTWNKEAGIVIVIHFGLRECQLLLAWFSICKVEAICFSNIDSCLDFAQGSVVPPRVRIY
jgi:hypothetical protein